ncbi:hypothetical protein EDEG_00117 [Edhazardia aedis USNM 41457]|uniref:Uncharacterized protein n=1 Tax=Edhazardia aedis (strain USNM 41457) TaxID=1003232 RepID=J9DUC5_EDHAE|nr:hypothetical protein EDEG_00117 [Edhazardia aedis USNM 41457]|eukprot:EJW04897.1 hypothetical protein EDEG_00117 [Edhazardia aedis USNM 41457]
MNERINMKGTLIIFYVLSSILILIAALQRSRHEELVNEKLIFLLPIFTILAVLVLKMLKLLLPKNILIGGMQLFFSLLGCYTLLNSIVYLAEVMEYRVEKACDIEIESSDFEELLINPNGEHQKKRKTLVLQRYLKNILRVLKNRFKTQLFWIGLHFYWLHQYP